MCASSSQTQRPAAGRTKLGPVWLGGRGTAGNLPVFLRLVGRRVNRLFYSGTFWRSERPRPARPAPAQQIQTPLALSSVRLQLQRDRAAPRCASLSPRPQHELLWHERHDLLFHTGLQKRTLRERPALCPERQQRFGTGPRGLTRSKFLLRPPTCSFGRVRFGFSNSMCPGLTSIEPRWWRRRTSG